MLCLLVIAALTTCALNVEPSSAEIRALLVDRAGLQLKLTDNPLGGLNLVLNKDGVSSTMSVLGPRVGKLKEIWQNGDVELRFDNRVTLRMSSRHVEEPRSGIVVKVMWHAPSDVRLEDCVNLGPHHWYGGPQQKRQFWPIEKLVLNQYSYVTKEADNCGVAEPYWLSSSGVFYYFDRRVPLFVDQNVSQRNAVCFIAEVKAPYSNKRTENILEYDIGMFKDVRQAHEYAIATYLNKPVGIPDQKMITYPIWSTWARYKRDVNHSVVLEFADEINSFGFPNSQFEIDDLWEICYGSQTVDVRSFPDMKDTVDKLKEKGFRVTIWTHPFINKGCEPWYSEAKSMGYLVTSEAGSVETSWWNDNGTTAAYLDFTKPEVQKWYSDRLRLLQTSYGIDSFKFDAGESSWSPQVPVLQGDEPNKPGVITEYYVRTVAQFGPLVEVRAGYRTQDLPIFVRIIDKDTYWSFENGLPTLVTTLLQMNMNGYPLVLPDMIGGNGYNEPPSAELFIRWLQANVFMPSLQFSYVPWDFDNETVAISRKFVDLHAEYAPLILQACKKAVADGTPVNAPIWWIDPTDRQAQGIWDEFLLGDQILVAPVMVQGARSRHVYLPAGVWRAGGDGRLMTGGWHRDYPAPIDQLPFFIRQDQ